ncbi:unnamed protein product (macronuclear) [Paramecium tetraurelia]|uniref:Uncharacterized protein n=1 Tax=Paramecium tetraurelia TaxID=5888 RepID=A0DY97_PARTE|nr:uncharacterized protein GSPATT00002982001 [Paramecium tetraurelia]CAK88014.1 unnamed protein product [Paramecium tetraurelia]|eukprot:XP_001455411.1 hypothetical protein (macronuclear) [Paramecium tetraurelia strain d4-2]
MISFMVMSNILSDQMKQQYKSKSVFWRQEKEKLLQTLQPKLNNQQQQRSRTSQRNSKYRYLVESLYHQDTPENNKSIYNQFQQQRSSQFQHQQQQSSSKNKKNDELSFSTIMNKYYKQLEGSNTKQHIYDPFAEQIIESFQELKNKKSVKIKELEECASDNYQISNSGRKPNIINKINQIREFLDQQLSPKQEDPNKEGQINNQKCSNADISTRIFRYKSVESKQFLDQSQRNSIPKVNEDINKRRSSKSCTTLDVGIQVSLIGEIESKQNVQLGASDHDNKQNCNQEFKVSLKDVLKEQIQQTFSQQSQNFQSLVSQYQLPQQQKQLSEQHSERSSRRSQFQESNRSFINNEERQNSFIKEADCSKAGTNLQIEENLKQISQRAKNNQEDHSYQQERLSHRSNINCLIINPEKFSIKQNQDHQITTSQQNQQSLGNSKFSLKNKENFEENNTITNSEVKLEQEEPKLKEIQTIKQRNLIQIPKIINSLNFQKLDTHNDFLGQLTSVDTNRFKQDLQQILEEENSTNALRVKEKQQSIDLPLTSNRSSLSFTDPMIMQQTNQLQNVEESDVAQTDQRIIDNATVFTDGNLQYSEDTPKLRVTTSLSNNNLDEGKYQGNSQLKSEIQLQVTKPESKYQQKLLSSNELNCMNSYSFEQWLQQNEFNKKVCNQNLHSQHFQKQKCDHSTQINKVDSDSDEEIQFIKQKQQQFQLNQGITQLVRNISSILKIRKIKSFYEIREFSISESQKLQQQQQSQSSTQQQFYNFQFESPYQSQTSCNTLSTQLVQKQQLNQSQQSPKYQLDLKSLNQTSREQAACEKISSLLKIIKEETGSDTLRLIQNKQSQLSKSKRKEKKSETTTFSQKCDYKTKNNTPSPKYQSVQLPVEQINDRIKVNLIQDLELESPKQKHTEHAELNDNIPIAEPMEFQEVQVIEKQKREIRENNWSNNCSNILSNQCGESKNFYVLSNHIANQKAKIARKFQQIHYKSVGQSTSRKENIQF